MAKFHQLASFWVFSKNKFVIWCLILPISTKNMFFYHNIRQNLYISMLILCFIFIIRLPIYKHVFFNPKQSPRILYLSIILEPLNNTLVLALAMTGSLLCQVLSLNSPCWTIY